MAALSQKLFDRAVNIWDKISRHPFVVELFKGALPREKFRYYILQDYNYLVGMMRTFSIIASKAPVWAAQRALDIAHADATVEMENYKTLLPRVGLSIETVLSTDPAPTNVAYMNFMIATASLGSALEGFVATLPCFWSYLYIAEKNRKLLEQNNIPLYRDWAKVYLSNEYRSIVRALIDTVDRLYEEEGGSIERLAKIFVLGSKYEYMFWDMAYKMEEWPI